MSLAVDATPALSPAAAGVRRASAELAIAAFASPSCAGRSPAERGGCDEQARALLLAERGGRARPPSRCGTGDQFALGFREVDPRVFGGEGRPQRGDGRQGVLRPAGPRLRAGELQSVVEVVREEREDRAVDLDGALPLVAHRAVTALDQQARLAAELAPRSKAFFLGQRLRRSRDPTTPRRAQVGSAWRGVGGDRPLEQGARRIVLEDPQLRQAFGVETRGLRVGGQRRADGDGFGGGDGREPELLAQLRAGPRDDGVEVGLRALLGDDGDRLARPGVLEAQVHA
jgi:hypothetical protein